MGGDLSPGYIRFLNCVPSKKTDSDWTIENAISSGLFTEPSSIPATVDLREPWWSIGDQSDSGSTVGWATGDGVLRWHFVKKGMLQLNQKLSVRYIWMAAREMEARETGYPTSFMEEEGSSLKSTLDIARKFGVVTETVLPFRIADSSGAMSMEKLYRGGTPQTFFALASKLKIAAYFNLAKDPTTKLDIWKTWLASNGPILIALGVDSTWDNASNTKGYLDIYKPNSVHGRHCAVIVGYTQKSFIIRNSWGKYWGDKGFAYASKAYAQAAFNEAYGVTV